MMRPTSTGRVGAGDGGDVVAVATVMAARDKWSLVVRKTARPSMARSR